MVESQLRAESRGDLLRVGLREAEGPLYVVNPTRERLRSFVDTYRSVESPPAVKLFADEQPLKELVDDFLVASALADLIAESAVGLRVLEQVPRHSLLVSTEFVLSVVEDGPLQSCLSSTDEAFVDSTREYYEQQWRRAEEFTLRTPPLSHIEESLEDEISQEVATDFDRVLDTLDTACGNGEGLDEVTIALLVAANNSELLYDISRWGEEIQLASKATFSRCKNRLEDNGLIDTEKVPIEVGRPRLRLMLAEDTLQEADIEDVAQRAETHLP